MPVVNHDTVLKMRAYLYSGRQPEQDSDVAWQSPNATLNAYLEQLDGRCVFHE
jgi:hypothetical protein